MKIIFMGTPDFAVPILEMLAASGHSLGMVFTQPDKAKDRGKKIQQTPVKEKALALGIPVFQPEKIKGNQEILEQIRAYGPDLIVVAAYGQILPKEILELPAKGCINIHGSLLPKYRGAAPIQRAIMEGEAKTGITLMQMSEGLDEGDMLAKVETPIEKKSFQELHDELSIMGTSLLSEKLKAIEEGGLIPEKQQDQDATYAHMIQKKDGLLDFSKPAVILERQIRAFSPSPGAYTFYQGNPLKVFSSQTLLKREEDPEAWENPPGTVLSLEDGGLRVTTGEGYLLITEIQLPNKKRMQVREFLRGHKMELPLILG